MSHWADAAADDEDAEESLVRAYTITQGRTASARDDLTLITVITTAAAPRDQHADRGLQPEHRLILRQCRTPVALAEVAARLNLPVAVTKILVDDLIVRGRVTARPPLAVTVGEEPDMILLQAVKDALLRL
ncbi:DUF742 domain-containing protein [Streptomyces fulvoviolaceus]|uniref:DUF742 domain-containing protein n=1 Tax=Streptomyces fulvoviolaceus TaxID=285535 RepID=UPI0004C8CEA0|nr:DUF742 domain-containing protein [Streptomyces fulvoviolaceus]MCT9076512.1 DUF742 domain-containing protein [Streptomyces fulvoviolaceus]